MNMLQGLRSRTPGVYSIRAIRLTRHRSTARLFTITPASYWRSSAQAEHDRLIRRQGISYCGAYWGYGFHEDEHEAPCVANA